MTTDTCNRCGREAPPVESNAYAYWETLEDGIALICPDCVTPEELQAMDEAAMDPIEDVGPTPPATHGESAS
jgi:hypothetical protein